ncbi:hypothetical protein K458DRAFT_416571 [Lentithecium fluviatile CBS 122367]|uniref:Bacteriocin-protection, YdeI or OmpD-Associated n=1 Tax=Lentithecium fluviatile CBS 122367 TaxID=1168545 RepID=A0A6G1J7V5_9PLEO|nr:hypothetical protein K458DRAFT_416571 [Lentithecium fluviatile CBS 122367]
MSSKSLSNDLPQHAFVSATDFEAFLDREHTTAPGIYLKLAKKSSGIPSITAAEAVEVALCFGWIDGRANGIDDDWWMVRYTPRRAKSIWSQKNVGTISRLIDKGRMRPAGLAVVEAAKADGRWERAYAGPATVVVPEDLSCVLAAEPVALAYFESLNKSDRYSVLMKVEHGSVNTRAKRINALVQTLAMGKQGGTVSTSKTTGRTKPKTGAGITKGASKPTTKTSKRPSGPETSTPKNGNEPPARPRREGLRQRD